MRALDIAICFGVAVIFPSLVYWGVSTFSPPIQGLHGTEGLAAQHVHELLLLFFNSLFGYGAILLGAWRKHGAYNVGLVFGGVFAVLVSNFSGFSLGISDWQHFLSLLLGMVVLSIVNWWILPAAEPDAR